MLHVISGTNRHGSSTLKIAQLVQQLLKKHYKDVRLIDLAQLPIHAVDGTLYDSPDIPDGVKNVISELNESDGIMIVVPEYNGSMPGILKYFIDFWKFPATFAYRPVAFVGIGGRFGGLRPVEHLIQVFGYRNSFIFAERVILTNIQNILKDDELTDKFALDLLDKQAQGFTAFIKSLNDSGLHSNRRPKK